MKRRARIIGCGSYLPERILTNSELADSVDTSDEWIRERTGIESRHIAADGELTSDLALKAGEAALADAGLKASDIDMIVLATSTPDETFPATATVVQARLGMTEGMAFDIQAVCSGFVYAMSTADNFIKSGQVNTVLVIGAETFSRILDWSDRATCILFGDGAGAVVLTGEELNGADSPGILSCHLHSDGRYHDLLYVDGGVSSTGTAGYLRMSGRDVFKHAVEKMAAAIHEALDAQGMSAADVDWFVPHQANLRIINSTARKIGIAPENVIVTIDRHANTSAASIPLALAQARADKRIKDGEIVLLEALGGGFTWGSCILRW